MDSLTQLTLGGAVGVAVLGRQVGYRAALWGAVCGTLPDLDVFIDYGGPVENFTYHRGFSHSLFVLSLLTPLLVWLILKCHPQTRPHRRGWLLLVWLALITHPLLDSFTVYGTQLLWPLPMPPVFWSTIFIIDPLYTLPLLLGLLASLIPGWRGRTGYRLNLLGLAISSLYLLWTVAAKQHVETMAAPALAQRGVEYRRLLTTPAPFNSLLWRIVAVADDSYYVAYYSVLDGGSGGIRPRRYRSETELLDALQRHWPVQRLRWFTQGFYRVGRNAETGEVLITDLRMGLEDNYVFKFLVAELTAEGVRPRPAERRTDGRDLDLLARVWRRIWDPSADF